MSSKMPVVLEGADDVEGNRQYSGLKSVYDGSGVGVDFEETRYITFDSGRVVAAASALLKSN